MNLQSQRPLATLLALTLTAALWAPTVSGTPAARSNASTPVVLAPAAPLILM